MSEHGQGRGRHYESEHRTIPPRGPIKSPPDLDPGAGITVAVCVGVALWLLICGVMFIAYAVF